MKGSELIQLKTNTITVRGKQVMIITNVVEQKSTGEGKNTLTWDGHEWPSDGGIR